MEFTGGNDQQFHNANQDDEIQIENMGFSNNNQNDFNQNFYVNENVNIDNKNFGWEPEVAQNSNQGFSNFAVFEVVRKLILIF